MLILFSLASRCELRRALAGLGFALAAMVFVGETDAVLRGNGGLAGMILFSFPLCLVAWGAGRAAWSRDRLADQLTAQSELLERRRERTAELAVEVERTRLAWDLDLAARGRVRRMIELATDGERSFTADPEQSQGDVRPDRADGSPVAQRDARVCSACCAATGVDHVLRGRLWRRSRRCSQRHGPADAGGSRATGRPAASAARRGTRDLPRAAARAVSRSAGRRRSRSAICATRSSSRSLARPPIAMARRLAVRGRARAHRRSRRELQQ